MAKLIDADALIRDINADIYRTEAKKAMIDVWCIDSQPWMPWKWCGAGSVSAVPTMKYLEIDGAILILDAER